MADVPATPSPGQAPESGKADSSGKADASGKGAVAKAPQRSAAEIQADIEATRARLVATLDELKVQTAPPTLAAKAKAKVTGFFTDEYGGIRPERVAMVAGVVVGVLVLRKARVAAIHRRQRKQLAEVQWIPVPRGLVPPEMAGLARDTDRL